MDPARSSVRTWTLPATAAPLLPAPQLRNYLIHRLRLGFSRVLPLRFPRKYWGKRELIGWTLNLPLRCLYNLEICAARNRYGSSIALYFVIPSKARTCFYLPSAPPTVALPQRRAPIGIWRGSQMEVEQDPVRA